MHTECQWGGMQDTCRGGQELSSEKEMGTSQEHHAWTRVGMCPGQGAVLRECGQEAGPRQRWALVHGLLYED